MKKIFLLLSILLITSCEVYLPTSNDDVYYSTTTTADTYQGGLYYSFYNPYSCGVYYNQFGFYPYYYNNFGFTFFRYPFNCSWYNYHNFYRNFPSISRNIYAPRTNYYGNLNRTSLGRITYKNANPTYNKSYNRNYYQNYNRGFSSYKYNSGQRFNFNGRGR